MPPLHVGSLVLRDGGAAELEEAASCGCETAPSADCDPYDAPAESLRLRIGQDIDWSDVVGAVEPAAVLQRDDSTKGAAANPKCAARRSAAARSSLSSPEPSPGAVAVAVVIGGLLRATAGKGLARDHGGRRRSPCQLQLQLGGRARVFASGGEAADRHHAAEPGSPKVSCLGGVRSQPRRTAADEGITSGRRWSAWWLVADVLFCCCWKGRRRRHGRPRASEAE